MDTSPTISVLCDIIQQCQKHCETVTGHGDWDDGQVYKDLGFVIFTCNVCKRAKRVPL